MINQDWDDESKLKWWIQTEMLDPNWDAEYRLRWGKIKNKIQVYILKLYQWF